MTGEMKDALEAAAAQFEFYAREHAEKAKKALAFGTLEEAVASNNKAAVNAEFAGQCRAALLSTDKAVGELREMAFGDLFHGCSEGFVRDSYRWRGAPLLGEHGHWCADWDELPIDETCLEWPCACFARSSALTASRASGSGER